LGETAQQRLKDAHDTLTRAERQLAGVMLENYPMSGLGSITRLAEKAGVSTPTVARMVQKLGYAGFAAFQNALREELEAQVAGPITKRESWSQNAPQEHLLNRFTDAVIGNIRQTLAHVDPDEFDAVVALIADESRAVYVGGGRITHAMSEYIHLHLQVIRKGVHHIRTTTNAWPHALVDLQEGDVLILFDIRRYENTTLKLAEIAAERGIKIVLLTDQWQSPIARHAAYSFAARIEVPSAWDSNVAMLLLSETLIAAVQEAAWDRTRERMRALEEIFDSTRIFRKFV